MRVVIIDRSDALGGAAIASSRLCQALKNAGADARMLVIDHRTKDDSIQTVGSQLGNHYRFFAERLGIFAQNGWKRDTLFRIDTATHGVNITRHPWVVEADVLVLGWINQAMLSLDGVEKLAALNKPLVWVMHDMWNCTGVCHYAETCTEFFGQCNQCPILPSGGRLAQHTWQRKQQLYNNCRQIKFVAVSNWLKRECLKSELMRNCDITVISNAIDVNLFKADFLDDNPWNVEHNRKVFVMGAARLDNPIKGLDRLTSALQWLADNRPDAVDQIHFILYGALRDPSRLQSIPVPYTYLGYVKDIRDIYRHAHVVVSAATRESFGYTLPEGMACGCIAVTNGEGGQPDIVSHFNNGYVTYSLHPEALAKGIIWALENHRSRQSQHEWIARHFSMETIANQHLQLYSQLLTDLK